MKYALNGATVMPLDQEEEIRSVAAAGFDAVELRAPKIAKFLEGSTLGRLRRLLEAAGLEVLSINALEEFNTLPDEELVFEECLKMARWARELSCPCLVAVPGFAGGSKTEREVLETTRRRLDSLARIAEEFGVRVGLEFLGFSDCTVRTLTSAIEIVESIRRDNVGLVLDTFHFFLSGGPLREISKIPEGRLFLLHVNDVENRPAGELKDCHRVLPGRGVLPAAEIWRALQARELVGHASLELFRPEYWERPPSEFLPEALSALRSVFPAP